MTDSSETTGASAFQNHVAGIITTLGATWRTHGDGRIIFPRAPPWRARGYPVPAMLFGGEARAAVNLPSSPRGPLPSASQPPPVPPLGFPNSRARTPYGETRRVTSASSVFFSFPNKLSPRIRSLLVEPLVARRNRGEGEKLKFKRTGESACSLDSIKRIRNFKSRSSRQKAHPRISLIASTGVRVLRFTATRLPSLRLTPPP